MKEGRGTDLFLCLCVCVQDLFSVVRSRAHKKRSVASVTWKLGGGLELAVKLYQLLQPQTKGNVSCCCYCCTRLCLS